MNLKSYVVSVVLLIFIFSIGDHQLHGESYKRPKVAETDPYKVSDIISVRGKHTILPKGAALWVPERYKERFVAQPEGGFRRWPEFYQANTSWLLTLEVSLEEAKGNEPIDPKRLEVLKFKKKVIVAVYRRNPISVLELKVKKKE